MLEDEPPAATLDPAATDLPGENSRNGAEKRRDPNEPAAVVGLGASAGGIAVLQQFFSEMDPESGLAFVVVMHLSPEHESNLANVVAQKTKMPVMQVTEPVKVRPNHVYVIPPNHQLTFEDSTLHLVPPQQAPGRRVTIDLFFRTLAQAYGQRAVGVVLSGGDSDGAIGLKHIRAQGGVTIAQDPNEAEHDSMPATAISTGMVDWILPVGEMAAKLMDFVRNENRMKLPPEDPAAGDHDRKDPDAPGGETISEITRSDTDELALRDVLSYLRAQTGHDFTHYKRATVLRRVARRMQVNSQEAIPQYRNFLRQHPAEARALLQDLLIGVTHFFRDQASFAALEANIPQIFAGRRERDQIRIWVAGCASGEEAYSIAILMSEYAERLDQPPPFQIFASDLDEHAIQDARTGLYPSTIEADVSLERLRRFFERDHGRYRVKKTVREKVLFASHNLLRDPPFSRIDLVSCRNLLIYLNRTAQEQVFDLFHFALRPGGLLFIGSSETGANVQSLFSPVDEKHRIFVRRSVPRPSWRIPALPSGAESSLPSILKPLPRTTPMPPLLRTGIEEAWGDTEQGQQAGQERRSKLFGELHLKLLEEYGPPSVVVNEAHDIVHLSARAGRYLQFVAGEPTANLLKVAHPALRVELRTALFRATQNAATMFTAPQTIDVDGKQETVTVEVKPMRSTDDAQGFSLLLFHKQTEPVTPRPEPPAHEMVNRSLEDEVQFLKEQLNATVEQYEGANEELKASNEELQAVNEEMRSATEELETSKEELQSVNEELTTVNHELKASVEDLSRANTDLNNLMASTDIGTVFLDRQLRIQRFTPSAQKIFNLLPADLGRPISDITTKLSYPEFVHEAQQVLDNLATTEREVRLGEEAWFVVRIAPYRTQEDRIAGVVATFIDITRRKRAEEEVRTAGVRYQTLFELVPVAVYTTDAGGVIQEFNHHAVDLWGRTPVWGREKYCGSFRIFHPDGRPMPHEQCPMARVLQGEELAAADLEIIVEQEGGARHHVLAAPRAIRDEQGVIVGAINCMHDITGRKRIEEALRASEARLRTVADNVPQVIWTNEGDGKANYFNRRWYEYSGLTYEESAGPGWQAIVHPDDAPASVERWQRALAEGEVFDAEYRLRRKDGAYRWFIGRNVPLRRNGEVVSWFGSATDIDDLKQAEAALRETEERFRLLIEGARDYAMFLLDVENRITFWSKGAERVFGWSEAEAAGCKGDLIFTAEDKAKGAVDRELNTALSEGSALDRRWHVRKDGSRLWTDGIMTRLDHESGEVRGFAKIARDATEQQRAEEALLHAKDQMEQRVLDRTRELLAMNTELEQTMAQRQQLERELLEISEREKRRIGEDLHDLVCQELSATALYLKSNAKKIAKDDPAISTTLDEAAQTVNRNVGVARDLARGLQAVELTASGLKNALRELASQASDKSDIKCHFKAARGVRVPDDAVALHLYRIAQEAVTNAIKHSGAKNVLVSLDRNPTHTCVTVEDDGKGFDPGRKRRKGLGLHMMRYRANALGGELKVERRHNNGMSITCIIPSKPGARGG